MKKPSKARRTLPESGYYQDAAIRASFEKILKCERMLFNRLAEGEIELPDYETQVKASKALAQIKPMRAAIRKQIAELELLPQKLLAQVFES